MSASEWSAVNACRVFMFASVVVSMVGMWASSLVYQVKATYHVIRWGYKAYIISGKVL